MTFRVENIAGQDTATDISRPAQPVFPAEVRRELEALVLGGLSFILERQRPEYPFIDTKLDIASGIDFAADDPIRGPAVIYSWIQGRGLEALAEHGHWLSSGAGRSETQTRTLLEQIRTVLRYTVASMEAARARNGGRLPFMMDAQGSGLRVISVDGADGFCARAVAAPPLPQAHSFSDLFYAKGLMAAASFLRNDKLIYAAEALFDAVISDLKSGRFYFGQEQLDPKNPVVEVPRRFSHAGRMIAIGGLTTFWRRTGREYYRDTGLEFIRWIIARHTTCAGQGWAKLLEGDFWEFTTEDIRPWRTGSGQIWSDPGHANEFVGLAFAHLLQTGVSDPALERQLCSVLLRNFSNGFAASRLGIVKSFDLSARLPINTDMPWWSLPETMRAAALAANAAAKQGDTRRLTQAQRVFNDCWQSFRKHYVRPERGFMAVQCLDQAGGVSGAIPATPDADPCYHTGLSLLGCLRLF